MNEAAPVNRTAELIRSLPTRPKGRICELWRENFGEPPGKIRLALMLPILAFRIQERAYGGLTPEVKTRSSLMAKSLASKKGNPTDAHERFKPGTRIVREWKANIRSNPHCRWL